ncbi:MAG: hypothetical protein LBO05_00535, partial [Deltaproteobacteria bacterium]|nr:hypothetical protein [Deltaproteobacteria bacterium]
MTLNSKIQVPLPKSGIIVSHTGKISYVYKVIETFRNEKNQPTNTRALIGKLDHDTGQLIPNSRYYDYYPENSALTETSPDSIVAAGPTFLVTHILKNLGVDDILRKNLGHERAASVITTACFMACRGNIMENILDWCRDFSMEEKVVTSQSSS